MRARRASRAGRREGSRPGIYARGGLSFTTNMSESIHQPATLANGRSGGDAGSNGSQEGHVVEIIHRLTQDQSTTDREASAGSTSQELTSTSVMGILVGEGLHMANKAGSKIDFTKIAKQFRFMGSGK